MELPFIAGATIYLRYKHTDRRLRPGPVLDIFLWIAAAGMATVSLYKVYTMLAPAPQP